MSFSTSQLSKELNSVSDYFVWKSAQDNKPITNKKIQKLVYYAQAWNLVFNNGDNLFPDPIEAWLHGPAVRKLWHKYKNYGYLPVSDIPKSTTVSDDRKLLLNDVWRVYGKHDAEYLEALTHSEEPWQNARQGLETNENSSIIISNKDMQTYYTKLNA